MCNLTVLKAIFKRNFFAYFANPTGYVFICGFVLASGFAAFWPHEFFNANLANLDQLNKAFPLIALFFIPAITMSIWADERRQGTDELLLTLPASDLDVVLGKYLAAVAIFTVSLLFSLSNVAVLDALGDPDLGLLASTYLGYWMVGLTMLAIGMTASFLTSNLTVGFVLGVAFNIPLVLAANSDIIVTSQALTQAFKDWSVAAKFQDFARGVVSASSVVYFLAIVAAFTYLNMVLIGRRHWAASSRRGAGLHYLVRVVCALLIALGLSGVLRTLDVRVDASSEGLSSLSDNTAKLLAAIRDQRSVHIEAFVSPERELPEGYVQTRLNLLAMLDEIEKRSAGRVTVNVNETEGYKPEAAIAEQRYGIEGQSVFTRDRGRFRESRIWMGVAVTSGLDKVVIPFFDRGIPAEYELVRSIVSLAGKSKKTIGVVTTDAKLMGGFDPSSMRSIPREPVVAELEKQYEVKEVDPTRPIDTRYDVLLVVQPSSLTPEALDNVLGAIRDGQKAAIFEDPQPFISRDVPGTDQPRRPAGGNPFMGAPPSQPKADIRKLWQLLQVDMDGQHTLWQDYNPYPKADHFPTEFVFIGRGSGQPLAFNPQDPITSGLQQALLLCPGDLRIKAAADSTLRHTRLLLTGKRTGVTPVAELFTQSFFGGGGINPNRRQNPRLEEFTTALRITGKLTGLKKDPHAGVADAPKVAREEDKSRLIDVDLVLVSDIDVLAAPFFNIRSQGPNPDMDMHLDLDNVSLVLNIIDSLAGDDRFIEVRKRRRVHRTLTAFEQVAQEARVQVKQARERYRDDFQKAVEKEEKEINERVTKIARTPGLDERQFQIQIETARRQLEKALTVRRAQLERERDNEIKRQESQSELAIRERQNRVKRLAVFLPPVLPLLIGLAVFLNRRSMELEGAVKSRLR